MLDVAQLKPEQLKEANVRTMLEREVAVLERGDIRLEAEALATWLIRNRQATPPELQTLRIRAILVSLPLLSSEEVRNFLRSEGTALAPHKDRVRARIELWGAGRETALTRELLQELELALKQKTMPPLSAPKPETRNLIQTRNLKPEIRNVPPPVPPRVPPPSVPSRVPVPPPVLLTIPLKKTVPPPAPRPMPPPVAPKRPVPPPQPPQVAKPETQNQKLYSSPKPEIRKLVTPVSVPSLASPSPTRSLSAMRTVPVRTIASGKPRMADIAPPLRLVSPVDELRRLDLEAFRKLGDANRATSRILEMLSLLSRESFGRRLEGIRAWRASPIYQTYLGLGQEALRRGGGLTASSSPGTLTEVEFHAISDLNAHLRK